MPRPPCLCGIFTAFSPATPRVRLRHHRDIPPPPSPQGLFVAICFACSPRPFSCAPALSSPHRPGSTTLCRACRRHRRRAFFVFSSWTQGSTTLCLAPLLHAVTPSQKTQEGAPSLSSPHRPRVLPRCVLPLFSTPLPLPHPRARAHAHSACSHTPCSSLRSPPRLPVLQTSIARKC